MIPAAVRTFTGSGAVALLLGAGRLMPATAQGLPPFAPINPLAGSRTGLSFEPYRDPQPGRWSFGLAVDYASTIEYNRPPAAEYVLDSELLRARFSLARDLGSHSFLSLEAGVQGAYGGFLDGVLHWYHRLLGIDIPERDGRPRNSFLYHVALPDATSLTPGPSDLALGDVRIGFGRRHGASAQTMLVLVVPTASGPAGYRRDVLSAGLLNTVRVRLNPRLMYEGSLSAGYTASHGPLAAVQRELLFAGSSGLRLKIWGRQSLYANLFYHSPYYERTTLPSLDRRELSLDLGWILTTRSGREWRVGLTEDLEPGGPAVDLVLRLGGS